MALIKDAELFFAKLDPKRPNAKFNEEQPTWEVQIRTRDKKKAEVWKKELHLKVVTDTDADEKTFYKVNLKRKSKKKDGTPLTPVKVVNGALDDVDPNSIGNGSIGDVQIFQYDYEVNKKKGIASMLKAIQLKKHIVYTPPKRDDDFEMTDTETVTPDDVIGGDNDDSGTDDDDDTKVF
jgi:hypothetical protein